MNTRRRKGRDIGPFDNETLIGSGATLIEKIAIGANVTVGPGSVVFARAADGATVIGNPAKRMGAFEK